MLNWYALHTKPRCESQVVRVLDVEKIETYLHLFHVAARPGRSPVRVFFPGYIFAKLDLQVFPLSRVKWMQGMRQVVSFDGIPARVDETIIAQIRERLKLSHAVDLQGEMLENGDHVIITNGPLRDVDAIFDRKLSAAGRVRVLIQLLNRRAVVEIESSALRKRSIRPAAVRSAVL